MKFPLAYTRLQMLAVSADVLPSCGELGEETPSNARRLFSPSLGELRKFVLLVQRQLAAETAPAVVLVRRLPKVSPA